MYENLLWREKGGLIKEIELQHTVYLTSANISWKVDFKFFNLETEVYNLAEAKGIETADYRIKLKLYRYYGIYPLELWKGNYRNPKLVEIIKPI